MRRLCIFAAGMFVSGAAAAADPESLLPPAPDLDALMGEADTAGFYARADLG